MKRYVLDGANFTGRTKAYDYMKKTLEFSDYFGNNLDALWDSVGDIKDAEIVIENARMIYRNLGEYGLKILDVFEDLKEKEHLQIKITW